MPKKPTSKPTDDIDWDAAISGAAVKAVTQSRSISRRKKKPSHPIPQAQDLHLLQRTNSLVTSNSKSIPGDDILQVLSSNYDLGDKSQDADQLTHQEINFLILYLSGSHTIDSAMKSAGYANLSQPQRYRLAKKVVKAYARGTEDKANIFRDAGLSEVEVAQNIKKLAETARSEQVKLNALALAAKCLRLTDEPERTHHGVRININIMQAPAQPHPGPPDRPTVSIHQQQVSTSKPLQITK